MSMPTEQIDRYRQLLTRERDRLRGSVDSLHDSTSVGMSDATEENGLETHLGDMGTDTFMREMDVSLEEHEQKVLDEVDAALGRLDSGTFGICSDCGGQIAEDRLLALPYVSRCVECSEKSS